MKKTLPSLSNRHGRKQMGRLSPLGLHTGRRFRRQLSGIASDISHIPSDPHQIQEPSEYFRDRGLGADCYASPFSAESDREPRNSP